MGVQLNVSLSSFLINLDCEKIYDEPYSHRTTSEAVREYPIGSSPYTFALVGAYMGTESDSPTFTLAAVALYDDVFKPTTETEKPIDYIGRRSCSTHESNGAFWYFCPKVHPMHTGTS